ncbi:MAG: 30S ribosomal protein S5 [Defluviitaleaceae bacterium]|nr:30S ribosomal protein S5 [Defluviitaleaceae bacterium]
MKKKIDHTVLELKEKVVENKPVTKVTKGENKRTFAAVVVVGDGNGHVGVGLGKAREVQEAIRKGREDAAKHLIYIERDQNDSIFHETVGRFGAASVMLKPAGEGTGVIAGGAMRDVMEMAGIRNIVCKSLGSANKRNVVNATLEGLENIKNPAKTASLRGKKIEEVS